MTKDGAVAENLSTGDVEHISGRQKETDVGSKKHQSSRLQFSQEDLENPALADAIHRSNAAADRLDATKENIPKRRKKVRQRIYDEATGRAKTVSVYQEADRPPNTKLRHDPIRMPLQRLEQEIHSEVHKVEQENVGVEAGHKGEELAERGLQLGEHGVRRAIEHQRQKPWRDVEKAQRAFDQANAEFAYQKAVQENPGIAGSNPVSRYLQKKRIQRQYIRQTRQRQRATEATGHGVSSVKSPLQKFIQKVKQSKGYLVVVLGIGVLLVFLIGGVSSCSVMAGSGISSFVSTSYLSEDKDMLDAESAYRAMEVDLQDRLRNYERTHSYDEYHFELDTIEHDPYVLISLLSALHDGVFTIDQVKDDLNRLFGLQYIYGTLTNSDGKDPIDYDAIMKNPAEFYMPATDAVTGTATYFSKYDIVRDDYRTLMATCALPGFCRPVQVNHHYYYDGGVADSIPVQHALDDGCDKLVVILSNPRDFVKQPEAHRPIYKRMLHKYPKTIEGIDHRHINYQASIDLTAKLEKEGKAFVFAPSKHLNLGTFSKDAALEQKLYDLGVFDYKTQSGKLLAFLQK